MSSSGASNSIGESPAPVGAISAADDGNGTPTEPGSMPSNAVDVTSTKNNDDVVMMVSSSSAAPQEMVLVRHESEASAGSTNPAYMSAAGATIAMVSVSVCCVDRSFVQGHSDHAYRSSLPLISFFSTTINNLYLLVFLTPRTSLGV
jgi:hypothetical protein